MSVIIFSLQDRNGSISQWQLDTGAVTASGGREIKLSTLPQTAHVKAP